MKKIIILLLVLLSTVFAGVSSIDGMAARITLAKGEVEIFAGYRDGPLGIENFYGDELINAFPTSNSSQSIIVDGTSYEVNVNYDGWAHSVSSSEDNKKLLKLFKQGNTVKIQLRNGRYVSSSLSGFTTIINRIGSNYNDKSSTTFTISLTAFIGAGGLYIFNIIDAARNSERVYR